MTAHTQFHEGQEVEVRQRAGPRDDLGGFQIAWRKAKIVTLIWRDFIADKYQYRVEFQDGTFAIFNTGYIRGVSP